MNNKKSRAFIYRIGQEDKIIYVNKEWVDFAKENLFHEFKETDIIDKILWDYIKGDEVQHLYKIMFKRIRAGGSIKSLPFRCDSPDCRRFMEMDLCKVKGGQIQIECRILREEIRKPIPLLSDFRDMSKEIITICSYCKKTRIDSSTWVEVEEAIKTLGLDEVWPLPGLSHGICNKCLHQIETKIEY